jgi:hypothetical protein
LARALNRGIDAARAELIAVTGDDCEPADDWLESVVTTFDHHPVVGVVHGNVEPCDHDATRGFVQASVRTDTVTVHAVEDLPTLVGTSANIAIRRAVATALAGFDETFGIGAPLAAAEDVDFVLRALAGGWAVHEAPAIRVTHQDIWPPTAGRGRLAVDLESKAAELPPLEPTDRHLPLATAEILAELPLHGGQSVLRIAHPPGDGRYARSVGRHERRRHAAGVTEHRVDSARGDGDRFGRRHRHQRQSSDLDPADAVALVDGMAEGTEEGAEEYRTGIHFTAVPRWDRLAADRLTMMSRSSGWSASGARSRAGSPATDRPIPR